MAILANEIIKNNKIPNLILLFGNEDYLKRQFKKKLSLSILPNMDSMNYSYFSNESGRKEESEKFFSEMSSIANTTPFFSEKRLIVCENSGFFKNKFDGIKEFLEGLPDFTYIIFVEREVSKATVAFKTLNSLGFVEEYTMPDNATLSAWVNGKLKPHGLTMDRDALMEFIERTAINMDNMDNELNKLSAYCMNRGKITLSDVRDICIANLEEQIFNIINAISAKDKAAAMREYAYLYALRTSPRSLLALLTKKFTQFLELRLSYESGLSDKQIMAHLGIKNDYAYKKTLESARHFSGESLKKILNLSAEYQQKLNTGLLSEQTGIEMFILKTLKA